MKYFLFTHISPKAKIPSDLLGFTEYRGIDVALLTVGIAQKSQRIRVRLLFNGHVLVHVLYLTIKKYKLTLPLHRLTSK